MRKLLSPRWGVFLLLIAILALSGCQGGAGGQVSATGGLQVWLDQPPDGASLPLAEFALKAHARDDGGPGVQAITFYVNGLPLGSLATDPTLPLAYAETTWNPAAPGVYTIQAEASNGGSTALSAPAHVCVGDSCEQAAVAEVSQEPTLVVTPTVTFTPIPGVTPTVTLPPTITPTPPPACNLAPPQPATPTNGDAVTEPMPTLTWIYPTAACQPESYRIDICSDAACATVVGGGATGTPGTSWAPAQPLSDCSIYYWRVGAIKGSTFGPYSDIFHFATAFPNGCGAPTDKNPPAIRVPNKPTDTSYREAGSQCPNNTHLLVINADVRDDVGIKGVLIDYRYWDGQGAQSSNWVFSVPMVSQGNNIWQVTINNNDTSGAAALLGSSEGSFEFVITATDTAGNQTTFNDHTILVHYCGKP